MNTLDILAALVIFGLPVIGGVFSFISGPLAIVILLAIVASINE